MLWRRIRTRYKSKLQDEVKQFVLYFSAFSYLLYTSSSPQTLSEFKVCFSHFSPYCCFRLCEVPGVWLAQAELGGDGGTASTSRCPLWVAFERREVQTEGLMLLWDSPQEEALFSGSHFHAGSIITSAREKNGEEKKVFSNSRRCVLKPFSSETYPSESSTR